MYDNEENLNKFSQIELPQKLKKLLPDWIEYITIGKYGLAFLIHKPNVIYDHIWEDELKAVLQENHNNSFLSNLNLNDLPGQKLTEQEHKMIGIYVFNKIERYLNKNFPNIQFVLTMTMQIEPDWDWVESKVFLETYRENNSTFVATDPFYKLFKVELNDGTVDITPVWRKIVNSNIIY